MGQRLSKQGLMILKFFLEDRARRSGADIMRETGLSSGTTYPVLYRFEREGLLEGEWEVGDPRALGRRLRKFYTITPRGLAEARAELAGLQPSWLRQPAFGEA
jgi:PadR family transcriptional regulator PadR